MSLAGQTPTAPGPSTLDWRKLTLAVALGLGVVTQAALALMYGSAPGSARDTWSVALALALLLAIPGAGIIWATWRAREVAASWRLGLMVAVAGLVMRVPYFGAGMMLEDDHFRYLLDGAMVAKGLSPYAFAPDSLLRGAEGVPLHVVEAGRTVIAAINFPELRSMYPGAAQALFALAHVIAPWSIDGLRVVIFAAEAMTALLIWRLLAGTQQPQLLVALYWCNPLMAFCLTGQAHVDAALAPPIMLALLAAHRRMGLSAGLGLGLAVGVKLWPILLAPLIARALWPDRRTLAGFVLASGGATLLLCGPLLWASLSADAGLTAYAGGWSVNNAPYAWLSYGFFLFAGPGTGERVLRALVILAAAAASLAIAYRKPEGLESVVGLAAVLAAALFYLSPAQFPWYAAWFVPLAVASGNRALVAASVGLPVYYLFFPLAAAGLRDVHGYGLAALHLVPVLLALLIRKPSRAGAMA